MELSTYIWNISPMTLGMIVALEYTIKAARTQDGAENFVCFLMAAIGSLVGTWNLICLLVKLNVITP
jgi:hypothetical protein